METMETMDRLSLRKNFSWSFTGNMIYAGGQFLMLMCMTKLLAADEVGLFVLATAIITPIQMFMDLQLRGVVATDVRGLYDFGEYFALRIITCTLSFLLGMTISFFIGKGLHMILVMLAVCLFKTADSLADVIYGQYIQRERLDKVAFSRTIRAVFGVLVFIPVLWLTKNIVLALTMVFVTWIIVICAYDLSSVRKFTKISPQFNIKRLRELAILALPLGVTMTLVSLNSSIPRFFTEKYIGTADLGYFGALAYIIAVLGTAVSAVASSASARMSRYYIDNITAFITLLVKMVIVAVLLGLIGVAISTKFGVRLLTIFYSFEYAQNNKLFVWLMVAGGMGYVATMVSSALTSARIFKMQIPLCLSVTFVLIVGSIIFIPRYGTIGAAWVVLAGMTTQAVVASVILIVALGKV
jgi:O-antigen/teichoic acid export membrane protein